MRQKGRENPSCLAKKKLGFSSARSSRQAEKEKMAGPSFGKHMEKSGL